MTQILGHNYIGGQRSAQGSVIVKSVDANTGEALAYDFYQATLPEVDRAARAAAAAYPAYKSVSAEHRATFLDAIADELDALGDEFVALVCRETALPAARIAGERGRTSGQMRLFAKVLRRGDFYGALVFCNCILPAALSAQADAQLVKEGQVVAAKALALGLKAATQKFFGHFRGALTINSGNAARKGA